MNYTELKEFLMDKNKIDFRFLRQLAQSPFHLSYFIKEDFEDFPNIIRNRDSNEELLKKLYLTKLFNPNLDEREFVVIDKIDLRKTEDKKRYNELIETDAERTIVERPIDEDIQKSIEIFQPYLLKIINKEFPNGQTDEIEIFNKIEDNISDDERRYDYKGLNYLFLYNKLIDKGLYFHLIFGDISNYNYKYFEGISESILIKNHFDKEYNFPIEYYLVGVELKKPYSFDIRKIILKDEILKKLILDSLHSIICIKTSIEFNTSKLGFNIENKTDDIRDIMSNGLQEFLNGEYAHERTEKK